MAPLKKQKLATQGRPKQKAGDPNNPSTFMACNENENQTTAYLGYAATNLLRDLAASWPLLRAYTKYHTIMSNLRAHDSLRLLGSSLDDFLDVADPDAAWPIPADEDRETASAMKARHLAWLLVRLKADIEAMTGHTPQENQDLQKQYLNEFSAIHTNVAAPVASPNYIKRTIAPPTLGPLESESAVEPYNRCLNVLKYLQHGLRAKKFFKRLSDEPKKGKPVEPVFIPEWMLPRSAPAQEIPVTKATRDADNLPEMAFGVNWSSKLDAVDLEAELDELDSSHEKPSSKQSVNIDPRLFPSMASFRDQLRRQYSCNTLHMQIRRLNLDYKTSDGNSSANLMRDEWEDIQAVMRDPANRDFLFNIGFEPTAEGEDIFETDYHPGLDDYFRPSDNDAPPLEVNDLALQERAAGLQQNGSPHHESTTNTTPASTVIESPPEDAIKRFLDHSGSLGSTEDEIGEAPDPSVKFPGDVTAMQAYYDGLDITQPDKLLHWQVSTLGKITNTAKFGSTSYEKPKRGVLSKEVESTVAESQFLGAQTAESRERRDNEVDLDVPEEGNSTSSNTLQQRKQALEDNEKYYTLRAAYSGTQAQVGPPLNLCLDLLACEEQSDGLWRSKLLAEVTDTDFYHYQLSGAVGCILKLYGRVDLDALLSKSKQPYTFDVERVKRAAEKLNDLITHGAILADDVGFGKTKQLLLIAYLHILLGKDSEHRPTLLVVPSTLVHGWITELREHWKCFHLVVSFEDHDWKPEYALNSLKASHMQNFGVLENAIPKHLSWLFDKTNPQAKIGLVLTSYETHKTRTAERAVELVAPGEHHDPPRKKPNGRPDWLRKPRFDVKWKTKFAGAWGLLLADEAQKVKNYNTGLSAALYCQNIPKIVLATATPFHNHVRDFLGMTHLLGTQARAELNAYLSKNPDKVQLLQQWEKSKKLMENLDQLPHTDPCRLRAIDSKLLMPIVNSDKDSIHKRVMIELKPVLETVMIRRSASSKLQNTDGTDVPLRSLFKKTIRKTVTVERLEEDELEYQMWHQEAAGEYDDKMSKARKFKQQPPPGQPIPVSQPAPFALPMGPLRRLGLANFSTKMARLNANMERMEGDTHVSTLQKWREGGKEADFLVELTRTRAERKPRTAAEVSIYLAKGSPTLALLCKEILAGHILQPLSAKKYGNHQKLIIAESTPANAYWIQVTLRSLCIDARVLHAGLSNKAKAAMVDLFNDPESSLKALIMMYDVGAAGLNLHEACNRVFIASIARAFAQEEQVGGRTNRITSVFDTRVTRRFTPNSHDLFRASIQADKVTVQLATNAQDPEIQTLMVAQLNKLQEEVNACHESEEGQDLLKKISQHNTLKQASKTAIVAKGHKYDLRKRGEKKRAAYDEQCAVCGEDVGDGNGCICNQCCEFAHADCRGLDLPIDAEFYCRTCIENGSLGDVDQAALTDGGAYIVILDDDNDEYLDASYAKTKTGPALRPDLAEDQLFDEPDLLLGDDNLAEWVSENQPNDDDRKRLVLLSLPAGKTWAREDLDDEHHLRIGLLLLFNLIQGKDDLAINRSIHINYSQLSAKAREYIAKRLDVSKTMEKRQEQLAKSV